MRAQQAGSSKRHEIEQLLEVVLHRRGRQQQDVLLLQFAGELPELPLSRLRRWWASSTIDQVPFARQDRGTVRLALGGVQRGDDQVVLMPGLRAALRNAGSSWLISSSANLRRISPCHCSINEGGVNTRTERTRPRMGNSESTRPASMVLPSPTSSHSMPGRETGARPSWPCGFGVRAAPCRAPAADR